MQTIAETTEPGVTERRFDLTVGDRVVPGLHWLPEAASAPHPTVLIGHGGTLPPFERDAAVAFYRRHLS
jgi:hypothetical protein